MRELLGDIELNLGQAVCMARAMLKVANADGVHPREQQLVTSFYEDCCHGDAAAEALDARAFDLAEAHGVLNTLALKEATLKSCYLVALVHGAITPEEKNCLSEIGAGLEVSEEDSHRWLQETQAYLLGQFAAVSTFRDEVKAIAAEMGLSEAEAEALFSGK